ncbi:histidine kinase [Aliidiomarina taiwanensis]|uniref:Histidine kinase n=1 Tax=Aliidiomarina taiwanensis TaxID=946228 RepID=A0A432X873_9GAMM|nr:Hpt domain-containing protein [Aliidiomarina taiwanensis]RUO42947.1 histidine kinase [Aliidiomarina taiwanensis]
MSALDTNLLEQYTDMLGIKGLRDSLNMFIELMPEYMQELDSVVHARDEQATRSQAHKMKGACRSLGFSGLAQPMEHIEKNRWTWEEVEQLLESWPNQLSQDIAQATAWLDAR